MENKTLMLAVAVVLIVAAILYFEGQKAGGPEAAKPGGNAALTIPLSTPARQPGGTGQTGGTGGTAGQTGQ